MAIIDTLITNLKEKLTKSEKEEKISKILRMMQKAKGRRWPSPGNPDKSSQRAIHVLLRSK